MNDLEKKFYKTLQVESRRASNEFCCSMDIKPQVIAGIYKVDFLISDKFVIEIDGYEYHKTKEQREGDYKRERYLLRNGFIVIRFTGTEIFLQCKQCAIEALRLVDNFEVSDDYTAHLRCVEYHEFMKQKERNQKAQA